MASSGAYQLLLSDQAKADLKRLDKPVAKRIVERLEWLALNAAVIPHMPLTGEWKGLYRLRVGDYRIIYRLNHEARRIVVARIGHRREIYEE